MIQHPQTWSTLSVFMLAMVLQPESQLKAQQEIDSVIGTARLPELGDRENLPYLEAIVQETFR
jgi:cytochrome P450